MYAVDQLLKEFGEEVGIPELVFDEEGYCTLSFDDTIVTLSKRENQERLVFYADVGLLPTPPPKDILLGLLEANALHRAVGDGAIGIHTDESHNMTIVVYSLLLRVANIDKAVFESALKEFIEISEVWTKHLADADKKYISKDEEDKKSGGGKGDAVESTGGAAPGGGGMRV